MWPGLHQIYQTAQGVTIYVTKGGRSPYNFRIRYREPGKRLRTPKHIHVIVDLYIKREHDRPLTLQLVDYILDEIISKVRLSTSNPPILQVSPHPVKKFQSLDAYGEYSVEFLLVITELLMIQEKTNHPQGTMHLNLFRRFRNEVDIFSVVGAAT